jgi:hypothetical protein
MSNKKQKPKIKIKKTSKLNLPIDVSCLPNGVTEAEFLTVLDNISKRLSHKFRFGYHDIEDMKQQAAIFAIEGLEKYDNSRPLENFLWTHVRNRLFNYKRNNYQRPDKPCLTCPLYDKAYKVSHNQCSKYENKTDCELYTAWAVRNDAKKNIMQPSYIDTEYHHSNLQTNDFTGLIQNQEIVKFLDENIQPEFRENYLKLKHGTKIAKQNLIKLQKHIFSLMETSEWHQIMRPENEDN